jgi:hypothetical protein
MIVEVPPIRKRKRAVTRFQNFTREERMKLWEEMRDQSSQEILKKILPF